jgi:surface polysaccharide O-acyltransferase-like enzyme
MLILDSSFCSGTANIWQFVGRLVTVIKIAVPILIIILGSWDLGKAVVASDDKAIKTATNSLVKRFVAGIVIFLLPTIVTAVFNLLQGWQDTKSDATVCFQCISNPGTGSKCDEAAKAVDQDPTK